MPRLTIRPKAWREINEQLEYLEKRSGLELAERFLDSIIRSAEELARMPKMAPLCGFEPKALRLIRRWPVQASRTG